MISRKRWNGCHTTEIESESRSGKMIEMKSRIVVVYSRVEPGS